MAKLTKRYNISKQMNVSGRGPIDSFNLQLSSCIPTKWCSIQILISYIPIEFKLVKYSATNLPCHCFVF